MTVRVTLHTDFHCSLERAFKSPMLCDVTKVHTGFGIMPRITHVLDDENWGQPGGTRRVFMAKTVAFEGGEACIDKVLERVENKYWKIELSQFTFFFLGFNKFVGEWETEETGPNQVRIRYTYTMHSENPLLYPLNWVFTNTFYRMYMRRVLERVRNLAYSNEPYQHP